MAIKIYTKEFAQLLEDVYEVNALFLPTFGGGIQTRDGIKDSDNFLDLKVSDTEAVIQDYSTDTNVAFGTGTGNSNRFGPRHEVKSVDVQVAYEAPLAIHDGVDNFTVNDDADQVIEERAGIHAEEWTEHLNGLLGGAIATNANAEVIAGDLTEEGVKEAFADARAKFVNNKVTKRLTWRAYVTPEIYNIIVEAGLTTTGKQSTANIDEGTVQMFKGFVLVETPNEYFEETDNIYFAADNVGVAGVGIEVYRLLDSEDFNGVAIQSAAKYGKYIPEENKNAIYKAQLAEVAGV